MGWLRKAGRKFQETKHVFLEGKEAEFVCLSCKDPVVGEPDVCPHCGEDSVVPVA